MKPRALASDRKNSVFCWLFAASALCVVCCAPPAFAASGWTDAGTIGEFNQQPSTTPGSEMFFFTVSIWSRISLALSSSTRPASVSLIPSLLF